MKLKIRLFGYLGARRALFFIFSIFFLSMSALSAQEKKETLPNDQQTSVVNENETLISEQNDSVGGSAPATDSVVPVAASDADIQKEMEKSLQETMIKEAKAYYPMVSGMSVESQDGVVVVQVDYDQPSDKDALVFRSNLIKDSLQAEIIFTSALLQKNAERKMEGDQQFVESMVFVTNTTLSGKLGNDSPLFFVNKIMFQLRKPVRWKVTQSPGSLRIEFRPYLAEIKDEKKSEDEKENKPADLVFQAKPLSQGTDQALGQSYANQRQYEKEVISGGEATLLESVSEALPSSSTVGQSTNYSRGFSEDGIRIDMRQRYPEFGTLEYWKKHLSGAISNTTRFMKRKRDEHVMMSDAPGFAIVYDRQGPAHLRLGYNFQREFPFFYGKQGGLSPMDGFIRQDIQGGVVFNTQTPWTYSLQNQLSLGTSENLNASSKLGDRLTTYQYELGQAVRYKLNRGYLQMGSGLRWYAEEQGSNQGRDLDVNKDLTTYLAPSWVRPLNSRVIARVEYNYSHTFVHDPKPTPDQNVHQMRVGLDYKLNKNITLTPSMGWTFYDGDSVLGFIGGVKYRHKLGARDQVTFSYDTDFTKGQFFKFGEQSLTNTSNSFSLAGALIRYHIVSAAFEHKLSSKLSFLANARYRRERLLETSGGDKFDEYQLSAGTRLKISNDWAIELKYAFRYLDASRLQKNTVGEIHRRDAGNTDHSIYLKATRFFGEIKR